MRGLRLRIGLLAAVAACAAPSPSAAAPTQLSIIEDDVGLQSSPSQSLMKFRELGDTMVRVMVPWSQVAPDWQSPTPPAGFDAGDPAAYPAANWAPFDQIVRIATADRIAVDFTVSGGAPRWAEGPGIPAAAASNPSRAWRPSARAFGLFVRAVAERYSGAYTPPGQTTPLPRVSFWAVWNEPNFGEDLAPQAVNGSTVAVAPAMYRDLVGQAWTALQATGHGRDTILIGETAPRGMSGRATPSHPQGLPGDFAQTKPLSFLRTLYCVDSSDRVLLGAAARAVACPSTRTGSRSFRAHNPALFQASGFSDHPYPQNLPPNAEASNDPNIASFPRLPNLERELDRLQRIYGSATRFPIYNTEYGYITRPPNRARYVSPATAAYYLNWAEYLSWRSQRIKSTMQFLLNDPAPDPATASDGGFASGLVRSDGIPKPGFGAYRLPLYLPVTSAARGRRLEIWGCVRPARYPLLDGAGVQSAELEFQRGSIGAFVPLRRITIARADSCYFDLRVAVPASGTLRLRYTYPAADSLLADHATVYSRAVRIRVH